MPEATIGAAVATKVFGDVFSALAKSVLASTGKQFYSLLTHSSSSLRAHTEATFERCTKIKTLLNRDEPVDLLAQYVNLKFRNKEKTYDDFDVIEQLNDRRRIVISGTGGGGKTIFMKYLWIALFENPKGKIPLFIELRRLNEGSNDRLDLFVYHSIIDTQATLSQAEFERGLKEGRFVLVLDGFDELEEKKLDPLEKQILALAHNNPELTIIVSSRAHGRFDAWQSFSIFHVLPLEKNQVVELVQKLTYERIIKKKFVERIRKDLYAKHKSFMSNPLLATMMLLTFDQFADIPEKIHLFYDQAFDTLFAKHDATKEAYKRRMYTDLSIDVFKRFFAYFCLATYYDEKFELSESECLSYIRKCINIETGSVDAARVLKDLTDSVCMLQRDGMLFTFTHRSFQEFFAAYCLARVSNKHIKDVLAKISRRPTDNVIKMLYDMDQVLTEREYVIPNLKAIVHRISEFPPNKFFEHYCLFLGFEITVAQHGKGWGINHDRIMPEGHFVGVLRVLYPDIMRVPEIELKAFHATDQKVIKKHIGKQLKSRGPLIGRIEINPDNHNIIWRSSSEEGTAGPEESADWFAKTGYVAWCNKEAQSLARLLSEIEKNQGSRNKAIDELLGLKVRAD